MIGFLQRVAEASVSVDGSVIAKIDHGLLVLVGVQPQDTEASAERLLQRLLGYRVFADGNGRMNLSVIDTRGGVLLVPQFTLAADTRKGMRPGFQTAADPQHGQAMFEYLLAQAAESYPYVASGHFGADMKVGLVNDGPVSFWLEV